jgi:hypothetical protein
VGLTGFQSREEADKAKNTTEMKDLFESILGNDCGRGLDDMLGEMLRPTEPIPELKWVKVIEMVVRHPEPLPDILFLVRATSTEGVETWFGVDRLDPALHWEGLRAFKSRAAATERQEELRIADLHGRKFKVMELIRKVRVAHDG